MKYNLLRSCLFVFGFIICLNAISKNKITIKELHTHVEFLTSDKTEGRYPGTFGDSLSAHYIADQFKSFGLKPYQGSYFQNFEVISKVEATKENSFIYDGKVFNLGQDFVPFSFSANAKLNAEVVYIGFGYNINTPHLVWNDFAQQDIEGKWVMILRGHPEDESLNSFYQKFSSDRSKVMQAKDMGAAGVLLVSGPAFSNADRLTRIGFNISNTSLPVVQITRELANSILSSKNTSIEKLEKEQVEKRTSVSFETGSNVKAQTDIEVLTANTFNVVGLLEGNKPEFTEEYIVIGGHYDHLGWGGQSTNSRFKDGKAIHPGADDNASGIASMLELAEKFASKKEKLERGILFIAFGAEEMGLIGSAKFIKQSGLKDKNISAMLNLDMVGRLSHKKAVEVSGVGTAAETESLLKKHFQNHGFELYPYYEGYGPSDYSSFYSIKVPVMSFTTGVFADYHTPDDRIENLNFEGMKSLSNLVYDLAFEISNLDQQLTFKEAGKSKTQKTSRKNLNVTLGIMPEINSGAEDGMRAKFVVKGKPADLGGMLKDDLIIAINDKEIKNIDDYMYRLSKLKKGQNIKVKVIRKGEPITLSIQL